MPDISGKEFRAFLVGKDGGVICLLGLNMINRRFDNFWAGDGVYFKSAAEMLF